MAFLVALFTGAVAAPLARSNSSERVCTFTAPSGDAYDIAGLSQPGSEYRIESGAPGGNASEQFTFLWNGCDGTMEHPAGSRFPEEPGCLGPESGDDQDAGCQHGPHELDPHAPWRGLGKLAQVRFQEERPGFLALDYQRSGFEGRSLTVEITCDDAATEPLFELNLPPHSSMKYFVLRVRSVHGCVLAPAPPPAPPPAEGETFQLTIGDYNDWPGAIGLVNRFIDTYPPEARDGGWVIGGWTQGQSAIARVSENGTVLWSHRLRCPRECSGGTGGYNSQTVVRGVAAFADGSAVIGGYTYHPSTPTVTRAFVLKLDANGEEAFSHLLNINGDSGNEQIDTVCAAADGGVMLLGRYPSGVFAIKLDANGRTYPWGGYVTDTSRLDGQPLDVSELRNGHFVYTGHEWLPNSYSEEW